MSCAGCAAAVAFTTAFRLLANAGEGIEANDEKAVYWYTRSANQGNTIAQNNLGAMYFTGEGIKESKTEAYKWFFIAGELGNDDARDNRELAADQMRKSEVNKGRKLALKWLRAYGEESPAL